MIVLLMFGMMGQRVYGAGLRISGIDPSTAYWGDIVRVYGVGATPNVLVLVWLNDSSGTPVYLANTTEAEIASGGIVSLGAAHAQASGDWEVFIAVPLVYPAAYTIYVSENGSLTSDKTSLNILTKPIPPFVIDGMRPSSGEPGTEVLLYGFGVCYEGLNILFDGTIVAQTTTSVWNVWNANFTVPEVPFGNHTVTAVDVFSGGNRSVQFPVEVPPIVPTLYLPSEGAAGSALTIYGQNFPKQQPVDITFEDSLLASTYVNDSGTFTVEVFVPMVYSGQYAIKANTMSNVTGQWLTIASVPFTVITGVDTYSQELAEMNSTLNQVHSNLQSILTMQEMEKQTWLYALAGLIISAVTLVAVVILVALLARKSRHNKFTKAANSENKTDVAS
jgi:hypothetical protein